MFPSTTMIVIDLASRDAAFVGSRVLGVSLS
jgi:hypothetical protein